MKSYTVNIPGFTIGGDDAYAAIETVCATYGKTVAILGGETALAKARPALEAALQKTSLELTDWRMYGKECSFANAERLAEIPTVADADMLFAVGGGKAIDTVKVIAGELQKPFFTFPTIAATCAAVTSIAAVYLEDHRFDRAYDANHPPVHTFINERIIGSAPAQYLWAGIGDSVAKYYESRLSARDRSILHSNQVGVTLSGMCAEPLMQSAVTGYKDAQAGKTSEALRQTILNVIVSTGFASIFLEPDYNTAVAHSLTYGLVELPQVEANHMHGELVSYGVLVLLAMDGADDELAKVYDFNRAMQLPTCLADIDVTVDELEPALTRALQTFDLNVMPYKVDKEMYRNAILALEEYDRSRKEVVGA